MSAENSDIRQEVKDDSGTLKKLQLMIPGLRGYRRSEDVRISDELLRNQVADRLDQAKGNLENVRKQLVAGGDFTNLTSVGSMISQVQQLSGEVRHSQQGYSGLAASISITTDMLNKLYDFDYAFVNSAMQLLNTSSSFHYDPTAPGMVQTFVGSLNSAVADFKQKWETRIEAMENILQH